MAILPSSVKACLWSYDTEALDLAADKRTIIFNVLNYGGEQSVKWLFEQYQKADIAQVIENSAVSEWFKKSLNFWVLVLRVRPRRDARFA